MDSIGMIAITLTKQGIDAGILVIHERTCAPLMVGDTPLSDLLFKKYIQGQKFSILDENRKRRDLKIPPINFEKFMTLGKEYFKHASLILAHQPCQPMDEIKIEDKYYKLRMINGSTAG
jgi:hypothetical protein